MEESELKNYVLLCLVSFLLLSVTPHASAVQVNSQQNSQTDSHQFEVVKEENLTELEKVFVEHAKQNKGVYQFGSLYVIALGAQPNPGYRLSLEKEVQSFEQLYLYVKPTVPEPGISYPEVVTYPFIVGRVSLPPYTTLSVMNIDSQKPFITNQNGLLDFMDERFITNSLTEWSITFSKPMTKSTLKNFQITIEKWGENKSHPVQLVINTRNKKIVKVKPLERYVNENLYLLHIKNIKNGQHIILPFKVKSSLDSIQLEKLQP